MWYRLNLRSSYSTLRFAVTQSCDQIGTSGRTLSDHFLCAGWARPQIYLRADIQAGISSIQKLDERARSEGLERLARDINNGSWSSRYGKLLKQESMVRLSLRADRVALQIDFTQPYSYYCWADKEKQ
jgi:hypothetical protein